MTLLSAKLTRRGPLDDVVDLPDVVVPAVQDAGDVAAAQLAVGHVEPQLQALGHLLGEPAVDRAVLLVQRVELVERHDGRVVPAVADLALDVLKLGRSIQLHPLPAERDLPVARRAGHDRHHHLAGDVPAEDDHVGLVEGGCVKELSPADLRSVDVRGEEDFHGDAAPSRMLPKIPARDQWSTSSGSSYQRTRSPTLALVFHLIPFGTDSATSASCLACVSGSNRG